MNTRQIDLNSMESTIQNPADGSMYVGSVHKGLTEYVCFDETGSTSLLTAKINIANSLLGDGHSEMNVFETTDLRLAGVSRRGSLLIRRFVKASMDEIRCGDKVILEAEDGSRHQTPKINVLQA